MPIGIIVILNSYDIDNKTIKAYTSNPGISGFLLARRLKAFLI